MKPWKWEDMNDEQKRKFTAATYDEIAGRGTKQKRNEQPALGRTGKDPQGMVNIPGEVLVRITRHYGGRSRQYDDDNLQGGCKELRDAIASMLGLKGDSAEDGIEWEYRQEKSEVTETVIQVFSKKNKIVP